MTLRVALVGGPMYDHLYTLLDSTDVEIVVHADHPTLNRRVAEMLEARERLDMIATHSKYAPAQSDWLHPLDSLIDRSDLEQLAPRALELCRFEGALFCAPRLIDVRIMWSRSPNPPTTWQAKGDSNLVFGNCVMTSPCSRLVDMNQGMVERNNQVRPDGEGIADEVFDDVVLVQRLAAGWPVWRLAQHYGTSTDEMRLAIGLAVTNCAGEDAVLFGRCTDTRR